MYVLIYILKFTHDGGDDDGGGGDPFFVMLTKNSVLIWDYQYFHQRSRYDVHPFRDLLSFFESLVLMKNISLLHYRQHLPM